MRKLKNSSVRRKGERTQYGESTTIRLVCYADQFPKFLIRVDDNHTVALNFALDMSVLMIGRQAKEKFLGIHNNLVT